MSIGDNSVSTVWHVVIAGTRGIPAAHGGFETFAEHLALYLVNRGWRVSVFCQADMSGADDGGNWYGISRVVIPVAKCGALGTIVFDWKSTLTAVRSADIVLVLGYNTAIFSLLYRLKKIPNVINMDGIEWKRAKWRWWQRAWLYGNERIAGLLGTRLIADHPGIREHLSRGWLGRRDIEVIPYGADLIESADVAPLCALGLVSRGYLLVIARPEPENQILEIVRGFSARTRGIRLVVLGYFDPEVNSYHATVLAAASNEVTFPGAIYDKATVASLRFHALLYVHGHTVGGTNPTLVEALGAGSAVLAHDNFFNRWVAGDGAAYFISEADCSHRFDELLSDRDRLDKMRVWSRKRFAEQFQWDDVLGKYERLLANLVRK
jgi:glycosyltransferase involved in cell wall biosynthesis